MAWTDVALVCFVVLLSYVGCMEREMTVNIDPGKEECFFESVQLGNTLTVEYQVGN